MRRKVNGQERRGGFLIRRLTGAALVLCLAAAPVMGQDGSVGLPSEKTAQTLSIIGSVAPWGILLLPVITRGGAGLGTTGATVSSVGLLVGPSLGFFYGGCWGRGILSSLARLAITGAAIAYVQKYEDSRNTNGVAYAALGALAGSAIIDCLTVKAAVRKRNAARMAGRGPSAAVAPFALSKGVGVSVLLAF